MNAAKNKVSRECDLLLLWDKSRQKPTRGLCPLRPPLKVVASLCDSPPSAGRIRRLCCRIAPPAAQRYFSRQTCCKNVTGHMPVGIAEDRGGFQRRGGSTSPSLACFFCFVFLHEQENEGVSPLWHAAPACPTTVQQKCLARRRNLFPAQARKCKPSHKNTARRPGLSTGRR